MLSRVAKLILSLILLLACPELGPGGRVEGSFALGQSTREPDQPKGSFGFEFQLVVNGAPGANTSAGCSPAGIRDDVLPVTEPKHSPPPGLPRKLIPAHAGLQTNGASPGAGSSAGQVPAAGSSFLPTMCTYVVGGEMCGLLFLADERFKPPPFPTRLFRPPRSS
jgi:hypothetical protein